MLRVSVNPWLSSQSTSPLSSPEAHPCLAALACDRFSLSYTVHTHTFGLLYMLSADILHQHIPNKCAKRLCLPSTSASACLGEHPCIVNYHNSCPHCVSGRVRYIPALGLLPFQLRNDGIKRKEKRCNQFFAKSEEKQDRINQMIICYKTNFN